MPQRHKKPRSVIERLTYFYEHENSNVHRGAHTLAARSTDAYEAARDKIAKFIHAGSAKDIVFVRGTTEGINLVARSWGKPNLQPGDEVIVTLLEHHANIVPWQLNLRRNRRQTASRCLSTTTDKSCSTNTNSCWGRKPRSSPSRMYPMPWEPSRRWRK